MEPENLASSAVARSFATFFETTHGDVFRAVLLVTRDWHAAEDATATAYLRAWEQWSRVVSHPAPIAWVIRVALNDSISLWRRARRVLTGPTESASAWQDFPDPDVRAAIDGLPLRQRQVLALRVLLGFDSAETGAILGIAAGTVGVHLSRALASCRERLDTADHVAKEARSHG